MLYPDSLPRRRTSVVVLVTVGAENWKRLLTKDYAIKDQILLRKLHKNGEEKLAIALPPSLRGIIIRLYHDEQGHMGAKRTASMLTSKYHWPMLHKDVSQYVASCPVCQATNHRTDQATGHLHFREIPGGPFAVISIDHIGPINEGPTNQLLPHHSCRSLHEVRHIKASSHKGFAMPSTSSSTESLKPCHINSAIPRPIKRTC